MTFFAGQEFALPSQRMQYQRRNYSVRAEVNRCLVAHLQRSAHVTVTELLENCPEISYAAAVRIVKALALRGFVRTVGAGDWAATALLRSAVAVT